MSRLAGKVAIVTGASKGIGAAIAKGLGEAGAAVVVNYASSREGADRVVSAIQSKGGTAIAVQGDISQEEDVKRLFDAAVEAFGKVNVLVNNAGVYEFGPVEGITRGAFQRHYEINVLGPILTTQQALKVFGDEGGSIINIGSAATSTARRAAWLVSASSQHYQHRLGGYFDACRQYGLVYRNQGRP